MCLAGAIELAAELAPASLIRRWMLIRMHRAGASTERLANLRHARVAGHTERLPRFIKRHEASRM